MITPIVVLSKTYKAVSSENSCKGCAGFDGTICFKLPQCNDNLMSPTKFWVYVEEETK